MFKSGDRITIIGPVVPSKKRRGQRQTFNANDVGAKGEVVEVLTAQEVYPDSVQGADFPDGKYKPDDVILRVLMDRDRDREKRRPPVLTNVDARHCEPEKQYVERAQRLDAGSRTGADVPCASPDEQAEP